MFTSIAGRAVVVTGATRGIGKGIARVFADNGARVLIVGRDKDAATAAVAELTAGGAEVSYLLADVSVREGCQRWRRPRPSGWAASTCSAPTRGSSRTSGSRT